MAVIKTIFKGESLSMLFTFPVAYDMARIEKHEVYIGETAFTGTVSGKTIALKLKSDDTGAMLGQYKVSLWIDDTILGLWKPHIGDIVSSSTNATTNNDSTSEVFSIIIPVVVSETAVTVGDILYNILKGDKGDPFEYTDFTPAQIAELQQPAADAIASIHGVELSVEQAEALRVQAEIDRQTNTGTAIQDAETATGLATTATQNATYAAALADTKAGLADTAATNANTKAGLADTAATNANTKAGLADTAATNANNVANGYAAELALKEVKANKQNSLAVDGTGVKFPTVDAVKSRADEIESLIIRKLVEPLGATYNTTTKLFSLNGLTDITEAQMINIYNYTAVMIKASSWNEAFNNVSFRTNIQGTNRGNLSVSSNYSFQQNTALEVFKMGNGVYLAVSINMFYACTSLREVDFIYMTMTTAGNVANMFQNCAALVTCNLRSLRVNLSFAWSPLLSLASLQYLITNRANGTTPITVTVHPTVFAKLTDNTNYPTWYAVNQDALTKYITFASA